jgi:large repetitive protein
MVLFPALAQAGFVELEWNAPTTNADAEGTPLLDLSGYWIYWGESIPDCASVQAQRVFLPADDPSPLATDSPVSTGLNGLTTGTTYWFRVSASDFAGLESACTSPVSGVAQPDVRVTADSIAFGEVNIGAPKTLSVDIENLGVVPLSVTVTTAAPFSVVGASTFNLPAGGPPRTVQVRFAPATVASFAGSLSIVTSGDDASVALAGTGNVSTPSVLKFSQAAVTVNEGSATVLTVTRTGSMHGGVTVDYETADDTAFAGEDYEAAAGTLTFGAGQTSRTITITSLQDSQGEGPERLTVTLRNPAGGATLGSPVTATVTITDDEPSLRFSAPTYTVSEAGGSATITVSRVGSTAGVLTVAYATTAGTALANVDYTPVNGMLTFLAGQASRTFTVQVLNDDVVDGPRTVGLALTSPVGASLGTPSSAVLTITDNDVAGTIQFGAAQYVADEGGGTFNIPVMRTGGTAAAVTATYMVTGGTAALGVDVAMNGTGTVTFGRGVTVMTIPVLPVSNAQLAGARTLELTLTAAGGGGSLGTLRRTMVTIEEVAFQFTPAVYTVVEGGTVTVTVTRMGPVGRSVTVDWTTENGTATADSDYQAASGTLTFAAGVRTRTFTVKTLQDTLTEGAETVLLRLGSASAGTGLGVQPTAVLTITDNDAGGRIAFGSASHVVAENRGTYLVPVTRTGGAAGPVTVDYTVTGGTATGGGVDYTLTAGTLTFAAGQTSATIPVVIADDVLAEANETVVLTLSNATGGASVGTPAATTVTIVDNDRTSTVQFSAATYTVAEAAGSATLTLTRTGVTTVPVTVVVTTSDGTAEAGADYTAVNTTVTFPAGVTSRTVPVPVLPNAVVDGSRTVNVTLSGATAPAAVGTPGAAVVTIQDDDSTLAFSASDYPVAEGGTATVTVRRTGSLVGTVSVEYAVTGGTAGSGTDYAPVAAGRLTFGPGVATRTFTVRTLVDAAVEGAQTVQVALSAAAGEAILGTPATATVTIVDNPPVVKFAAAAYAVTEGTATATITVVRTGPSSSTVTVDYGVTGGGTAQQPSDYSGGTGTLTFAPGVMSRTFTIGITNDLATDGSKTVVLELGDASGAVIGTPGTTTLTIHDNEPQVRFAAATYTVAESSPKVTIAVLRSGPPSGQITVGYEVVPGGTATNGADYAVTTGTLTFGPGVMSRTFTVDILNDLAPEGVETVIFRLTNPQGAWVGTPSTTTLTIVDNEPVVRFGAANYTVSEATPALAVTVLRTGPTTVPVTVQYAATGGTATAGQDYTVGGTGTLTFGVGVVSQTIAVAILNDTLFEGAEALVLTLSNPVGATLGTPATTTVTLTSNDVAGVVEFGSVLYSGLESAGEVLVTVIRRGGTASAVTVEVATEDGSAVAGTHYEAVAGTLTFAAGQTSITFAVPLLDDGAPGSRSLGVVLSQPGGGAVLGPLSRAVLWIVEAD